MYLKITRLLPLLFCSLMLMSSQVLAAHNQTGYKDEKAGYKDEKSMMPTSARTDYKGERWTNAQATTAVFNTSDQSIVKTNQGYCEIIAAVSVAKVNATRGDVGVTSSEIDSLVQTNAQSWSSWGGQLGLGYVYPLFHSERYSRQVQWFPALEPELNLYISNNHNNGDVYRFGSPDFNDLNYNMPIRSTRLMLDAALTVVSWQHISLYAKGGVGNAWNQVGYSDVDKSEVPGSKERMHLNSKTNSNLAWEAGAGLTYAVSERVHLSLEYLYTDLGNNKTASTGNTGNMTEPVISPASFKLHTQAVLLALHVAL